MLRKRLAVLTVVAAALWLAPGALASGWCGSGETSVDRPDVVTGQQVHAVVAIPADAPDTFAAQAGHISDDVASMVSWWQGQDPTRVPRYDQAAFGATSCLDVSFVRLPDPASTYVAEGTSAYNSISSELMAVGLTDEFKKYLVYFTGAVIDPSLCGVGAGDFSSGPSYAVVLVDDCAGVASDATATHELLHALGALPLGAPNYCRVSPIDHRVDFGHPCDSDTDVLYPGATVGRPLSAQVLDFNHDDYYAHSGPQIDIQDSLWLHRLGLPQIPLTVGLAGIGEVQSDLPGVDCVATCTTQWDPGAVLMLTALPGKKDRFVHWTGGCSGNADCRVSLSAARSVTAVFGPQRVAVAATTAGHGLVMCTPKCTKSFEAGDPLTLHAIAAKGWRFSRWTGACKGKGPICRPATDYALSARAVFTRRR